MLVFSETLAIFTF